jgi:hypothetical protein
VPKVGFGSRESVGDAAELYPACTQPCQSASQLSINPLYLEQVVLPSAQHMCRLVCKAWKDAINQTISSAGIPDEVRGLASLLT